MFAYNISAGIQLGKNDSEVLKPCYFRISRDFSFFFTFSKILLFHLIWLLSILAYESSTLQIQASYDVFRVYLSNLALRTPFYRGSDICLLTYAINDRSSFKALKQWREEFLKYADIDGEHFPFIVVGNKVRRRWQIGAYLQEQLGTVRRRLEVFRMSVLKMTFCLKKINFGFICFCFLHVPERCGGGWAWNYTRRSAQLVRRIPCNQFHWNISENLTKCIDRLCDGRAPVEKIRSQRECEKQRYDRSNATGAVEREP